MSIKRVCREAEVGYFSFLLYLNGQRTDITTDTYERVLNVVQYYDRELEVEDYMRLKLTCLRKRLRFWIRRSGQSLHRISIESGVGKPSIKRFIESQYQDGCRGFTVRSWERIAKACMHYYEIIRLEQKHLPEEKLDWLV